MDSILIAHVADAITSVTGNDDYDMVAEQAAVVLRRSVWLQGIARRYADGEVGADVLAGAVRSVL